MSGVTRDLNLAQAAFRQGNADLSRQAHDGSICEPGHQEISIVRTCLVWGALEGAFTSLALLAVLSHANLELKSIIKLGFTGLCALAIVFGVRDYLRFNTHKQTYERERKREAWELKNYPSGEIREMIELYESQGVSKEDATLVMNTMAKYKEVFVDLMMMAELRMQTPQGSPFQNAILTMLSSLLAGALPFVGLKAWTTFGGTPEAALRASVLAVVGAYLAFGREDVVLTPVLGIVIVVLLLLLATSVGLISPFTVATLSGIIGTDQA